MSDDRCLLVTPHPDRHSRLLAPLKNQEKGLNNDENKNKQRGGDYGVHGTGLSSLTRNEKRLPVGRRCALRVRGVLHHPNRKRLLKPNKAKKRNNDNNQAGELDGVCFHHYLCHIGRQPITL